MAKTIVEIVIDANNKATATIRQLGEDVEDVGKKTEQTSEIMDDFKKALTAAAIVQTGKAAYELAELGAQSLRTGDAFRNISGGAELAKENLEAMRKATRGAMSETQMMAEASAMLQMGIAGNADELARNAEMAIRLGAAMGTEAGPAMANWNAMIANKSIQRLDTYGISSGNVTKLMGELQEQIEGLSSEEAFRQAVFAEGEKALQRLGPILEDDALAFEQARARAEDYRIELAENLSPKVAELINTGLDLLTWNERMAEAYRTHSTDVIITAETYDAYAQELKRTAERTGLLVDKQGNLWSTQGKLIEQNYLVAESVYDATHALDGWTATIGEGYNQAELMRAGLGGIAEASSSTVEEVERLNEASNRVARSFGEITFDDQTLWKMALASGASTEALSQLAVTLGVATDKEIQLALAGQELMDSLAAGTKSPEEVARAWESLEWAQSGAAQAATIAAAEMDVMKGRLADTEAIVPGLTEGFGEMGPTLDDSVEKFGAMGDEAELINEQFGTMSEETVPTTVDALNTKLHPSLRLINEDASGIAGSLKNTRKEMEWLDGRHIVTTLELRRIGEGPGRAPSYQHGTPYVPETGLALLHQGEAVLPPAEAAAYRQGGSSTSWTGDIVVNGVSDPAAVAARVRRELEDRGLIPKVGLR